MNGPGPKPKKSRKRWLLLGLLLPVVVMIVRSRVAQVEYLVPHGEGDEIREIMGTGTIESVTESSLAFEVQGRISWVGAEEGDVVREGQALARIEDSREGRALSVAKAGREVAVAAVDGAVAQIARAEATRDRAKADFNRAERMRRDGAMSASDYDQAVERHTTAEASLRALQAARGQASQGVAVADRTIELQRIKVDDTVLRSPMDGLVVRRHRERGDVPVPGEPVFTVVSLKKIWARAWVDESALGRLRERSPARVELRSHPGKYFRGVVDRIGNEVDRQTHELLVDIELLERPGRFAVGTRADVWIAPPLRDGATPAAVGAPPPAAAPATAALPPAQVSPEANAAARPERRP